MTAALAPTTGLPGRPHDTGIDLPPGLPFEVWEAGLHLAERIERASPWWVVEMIAYGRRHFGEDYTQALPTAEDDPQGVRQARLKQAAWMADKFPTADTRVPELTYSHHRAVAELEPGERVAALREAVRDGLTTRELIDRVKDRQEAIRLEATAGHSEPATCAADAPWVPSLSDLLPEWRDRLAEHARGKPEGYAQGWLDCLVATGNEACFREGAWRD